MNSKRIFIILVIVSTALFSFFLTYLFKIETKPRVLPIAGEVPDFVLKDSQGEPFTSQQLKGKIWVADFIFTTCGGICPLMTKNMAQLHRSFLGLKNISLVSISVNPEQDTPEALKAYALKFNADTSQWHFLTGTRESIQHIATQGFKLGSVKEPVFHSAQFVLVDKDFKIRGYYEGTVPAQIAQLFKDIAQLMKEKQ